MQLWLVLLDRAEPPIFLLFVLSDLVLKPNDQMLQLIDLFQVLPGLNAGLRALLLVKLKFFLTFLEGKCELILHILHLRYEDLLVFEPLLQNPVLFPLPLQLKLHNDLIFLLLGCMSSSRWVLGWVERRVPELRSALRYVLPIFLLVNGLFLGKIGEVHGRMVAAFAVKTFLSIGALDPQRCLLVLC